MRRSKNPTRFGAGRVARECRSLKTRIEVVPVRALPQRVRVAWVSDVHFWRRGTISRVRAVILAVRELRPDVIVLGGDLVDGVKGLSQLEWLVRGLVRIAPVWALPGNHDEAFGAERVEAAVRSAGGSWLPDGVARVAGGAVTLITGIFDGRQAYPGGILVACLHDPAEAETWDGRARVVLAGHLHGGQIVLAQVAGKAWPCALVYRWCGPRFELPLGSTLLVGRGAGDLLPVRWRCPREVLCLDLVSEKAPGERGQAVGDS